MAASLVRVLVVDDDPQLRRALRINLAAHDYHVLTAPDGTSALVTVADAKPDAVILDLGLPDLDGIEVITRLRGWTPVPVVVLSARTETPDKIRALDAGADDYVTKPFPMGELLARLRVAIRHASTLAMGTAVLDTASFSVDLMAKKVHRQGVPVHLTRTEWRVAGDPGPPPRPAGHPAPAPASDLGPRLGNQTPLPAGLSQPPAAEARTRPHPSSPPDHRSRYRLPARTVGHHETDREHDTRRAGDVTAR